ncbi:MAG: nucleotidyltransferase domain-containing protein [Burkholderiales bacterium]|nr:nucleotidyltransferase domain-containing protein [Burkholderiales bacterium]
MSCSNLQLSPAHQALLLGVVRAVLPQARLAVFGSRATGRSRPFSDLDLLLLEPPRLSWEQRLALQEGLEASELPFRTDIVEATALPEGMRERVLAESILLD